MSFTGWNLRKVQKEKEDQTKKSFIMIKKISFSSDPKVDLGARQLAAMAAAEKLAQSKTAKTEPSPFAAIDFGAYAKRIVSFLARNFFTMKLIAYIYRLYLRTYDRKYTFYNIGPSTNKCHSVSLKDSLESLNVQNKKANSY